MRAKSHPMSTYDVLEFPNPILAALADLVASCDETTHQVSLVALSAARDVLAGRVPSHYMSENPA